VEDAVARYLEARIPGARDMKVSHLLRIPGGASRETWMLKATWHTDAGRQSEEFILRKDLPASLLETDRETEYAFYSTFPGSRVPVPRMRWLELDPSYLGGPFFVMDRIPDIESNQRTILEPLYEPVRPRIAREMYEILAAVHTFDWRDSPAHRAVPLPPPAPGECWQRELAHWERVIDENEISPQPIIRAAIRWLRRNPPPPAQRVTIVHGDYRVGNVLYATDGSIRGVVDWEMAHLGDPIEDIAWSFMADWEWARDGKKGGIITAADAIRIYEQASGLKVDPAALRWWSVFSNVKAQGIWVTGAKSFQDGRSTELIHAIVAWRSINTEDENALRSLGRME
jgi:aminoglycoside phosphotransferase (APT) family kinase protein